MKLPLRLFYVLTFVLLSTPVVAQKYLNSQLTKLYRSSATDSGWIWIENELRGCHGFIAHTYIVQDEDYTKIENSFPETIIPVAILKKQQLITIHGEVYYDFFYRSKDQTGLTPDDLQQHTERVSLKVLWKNRLPLRVGFSSRQSNSNYQPNFFDPLIQLDRSRLASSFKQNLVNRLPENLRKQYDLGNLEQQLKAAKELLKKQKQEPPENLLQKKIRERERNYFDSLNKVKDSIALIENQKIGLEDVQDSINRYASGKLQKIKDEANRTDSFKLIEKIKEKKDSLSNQAEKIVVVKKQLVDSLVRKSKSEIDSLKSETLARTKPFKQKSDSVKHLVDSLQKQYDSLSRVVKAKIENVKQIVTNGSANDLMKLSKEQGINPDSVPLFQKLLLGIRTLALGRSQLDCSELTVSNISLTGINLEYNSGIYLAAAAGKVDYRFRDYYSFSKKRKNDQYVVVGRMGYGDIEKKAVIFSVYNGRKNQFQFNTPDSAGREPRITGYSVQIIIKKNKRSGVIAEYAKSTRAIDSRIASQKENALWKFNDQSNTGFSLMGFTSVPETHTELKGSYRSIGENFQSFNVFSQNVKQVSWNVYITQFLAKNKIQIDGGLRQNDFTNPVVQQNFKTTNVFKSIAVSVRVPKYPFIKMGYYPGTQEFRENSDRILQNIFYILNGTASHSYKISGLRANTIFSFTRYINQSTDSGFAQYRGATYFLSQTLNFKNAFVQGGLSLSKQPELSYHTIEAEAGFNRNKFSLSGGLQYSHVQKGTDYYAPQFRFSWTIPFIGIVQFQYSKTFLPTTTGSLFPIEYGRFTYQKTF